jgi:hypothetical protein
MTMAIQQDSTQIHISHAHGIHLSHKITPLKKQLSSQSCTNDEEHITANVEKDKMKHYMLQALEVY